MSTNASEIGTFTFNGRLCGYICSECPEPLSRVKVRLYRTRKEQDVTERAVANPKETFAILSDEEVKAKQSSLIAETETDEQGNFSFQLDRDRAKSWQCGLFDASVRKRTPHRWRNSRTLDDSASAAALDRRS